MSGRDWLRYAPFVGAALALAFTAFAFYQLGKYHQEHAAQREHAAAYDAEEAREQFRAVCAELSFFDSLLCFIDAVNTERAHQRSEYDLHAQQDMAEWAFTMVLVSVAALGITLLATFLLWRTLQHTAQASEATRRTVEAYTNVERAWISLRTVEHRGLHISADKDKFVDVQVWAVWRNTGRTPANNVTVQMAFRVVDNHHYIERPPRFADSPTVIGEQRSGSTGPNTNIESGFVGIHADIMRKLVQEESRLFVYGKVEYSDTFGGAERRETEACMEAIIEHRPNTEGETEWHLRFSPIGHQNRAT